MFDFFGRVICNKCRSRMNLKTINHEINKTSAVFECSNAQCYDDAAPEWRNPRIVVYGQTAA